MEASETRRKAREFLKTLSGKYQLFIVSIVLAILTVSVSYRQAIFTTSNGTEFSITESVPSISGILSVLFLASASYAVLDVIRLKRDHVEVGDNMIVFSNELFGKYVLTAILKWLFSSYWSLIAGVGIVIFAIGIADAAIDNLLQDGYCDYWFDCDDCRICTCYYEKLFIQHDNLHPL
nr:DUF975 family protein [Streptococcus gallolyticus]